MLRRQYTLPSHWVFVTQDYKQVPAIGNRVGKSAWGYDNGKYPLLYYVFNIFALVRKAKDITTDNES